MIEIYITPQHEQCYAAVLLARKSWFERGEINEVRWKTMFFWIEQNRVQSSILVWI